MLFVLRVKVKATAVLFVLSVKTKDSIVENDLEFLVHLPQFLSVETADTQHSAQLHVALGINPGLCAH